MDIKNSYSMISGQYQYIYRATNDVETLMDVDKLYPYTWDQEQLYDLKSDPNQKENIFNNVGRMLSSSDIISEFQTIMREYIDIHCIAINNAQCEKPFLLFGLSDSAGGYFLEHPETTTTTSSPAVIVDPCFEDKGAGSQCCDDTECDGSKVSFS